MFSKLSMLLAAFVTALGTARTARLRSSAQTARVECSLLLFTQLLLLLPVKLLLLAKWLVLAAWPLLVLLLAVLSDAMP